MTARARLPNRRSCETFELECSGLRYLTTVSRLPDGQIGEIFLSNHETNSGADVAARDSAIVLSLATQHGADLEKIRQGLSDGRGRASGPLGRAFDLIAEHQAGAASAGASP
jgi:hypothetical protein